MSRSNAQAKAMLEKLRNSFPSVDYVDFDLHDNEVMMDGSFSLKQLECIVNLLKESPDVPVSKPA